MERARQDTTGTTLRQPPPEAARTVVAFPESAVGALASRLEHTFADPELLRLAVTHRSYCAENPGFISNERLEFLGDAVLGIAVTDHIFATYPDMPEGELAKLRAAVVSAATLAEVADDLQLGEAMRLGKGEDASGGRHKPSILADGMEAVFGALYLDGGIDAARSLILRLLDDRIAEAADGPGGHDFKTQLQELAARRFEHLPTYELRDEGPDHEKRFFAIVHLGGRAQGEGEGRSKKQAEQAAAQAAYERLVAHADPGNEALRDPIPIHFSFDDEPVSPPADPATADDPSEPAESENSDA